MISDPRTGEQYAVVDVHQHLSSGEGTEPAISIQPRIDTLTQFGIDRAVLLPPSGAFSPRATSATELNQMTAEVVKAHSDRFLCGVAQLTLADGEDACVNELRHAVRDLGLRGATWHHRFQGQYINHSTMPRLLQECSALGVPALIHVVSGSELEAPWRLVQLLEHCPDTTVIALDGFSSPGQAEHLLSLAIRHPNLYCDLGAMMSVSGWIIHRFIDTVGPDRVLLGTDLYMNPRTWYFPGPMYEILHMETEEKAKRLILADNAYRVFGRT